jgi:hypothetical protein
MMLAGIMRNCIGTGDNMVRKGLIAVVMTAALLMSGCASVPMASKSADAQAKQFAPSQQGMANLYIYRSEIIGAAIKMHVLVDGEHVGDTAAKTYIFKTLPAGSHTIVSKAENDTSLTIQMMAGHSYFVWQEVKMGVLYARSKLHLMDEAEGEAAVKDCDLAQGDGSSETALAAAPATPSAAMTPPAAPLPAATPAVAPVAATAAPASEATPVVADASPQPVIASAAPAPDSSANVAQAQSAATMAGCGAVQANGGSTFIAPCGDYSVLIDCYGGQCRPMHTVSVKHDE